MKLLFEEDEDQSINSHFLMSLCMVCEVYFKNNFNFNFN